MKKFLILFLILFSVFSLSGCGNNNRGQLNDNDSNYGIQLLEDENTILIEEEPIIEIIEEPEIDMNDENTDYNIYLNSETNTSRVSFVRVAKANEEKHLWLYGCPANKPSMIINWGEGETEEIKNAGYDACSSLDHTYEEDGIYTVSIGNISNLEALQINNMNVKAIRINGAPKLRSINLNGNSIKSIDAETFNNLPSLDSLSIAGNKLSDLSGVFINIPTVTTLNINDNLYKTVNAGFFTGLKKIEEIDICANKNLRMIEAETFRGLNNLVVLNIYNNQNLKTIEKDAFSGLDLLREINLSNNSISSLPEGIFINKEHLRDYYKNDSVGDYFFTIEGISVNGNCLKREELDEETVKILDKVASPNRAQSQKKC